jgi:hypothetical protein
VPSPQQRLDLDRVMATVDAKAAVVVLVGDGGELETVTKGIDNDAALFEVCFSLASQLAEIIFEDLPPAQRDLKLVLPTREDAKRLGILGKQP